MQNLSHLWIGRVYQRKWWSQQNWNLLPRSMFCSTKLNLEFITQSLPEDNNLSFLGLTEENSKLFSHLMFIAYKCNITLLLVSLNIVCLHGQKLYHWKEHLRRITVIYFYCENLQNYWRYRFSFKVLKTVKNYNIFT